MDIIIRLSKWWSDVNLKTRFIVFTILAISLIMSGITFWTLTTVQENSIISNNRFCKDLGILLASGLLNFVETNNQKELASLVEKVYLSTSSIKYILLFHSDGTLLFGLPVYNDKIQSLLQLHRNLLQIEIQDLLFGVPLVKISTIFYDNITDIIIPLSKNGKTLGSLNLGINSNPSFSSNSQLIADISITIFVSIWLMFLIGVVFNSLIIVEPIQSLLIGIRNIASGNFYQKVLWPSNGILGDLIIGFNEMSEKLESYEQKNVDSLMLEKIKLEMIVSTISDGVILIDSELRFLFVNHVAIKAFQWSNIDVVGQSIFDHFPMHVNHALLPILNNLVKCKFLHQKDSSLKELCINVDYNSNKILRFLLTTVIDYEQVVSSIIIIIQDISQEIELDEAKNQFIVNVSHELRTPLCNISSFLETLLDYYNTLNDTQKIRFLRIANNQTKRLSALVNDVLDLSQLESDYHYNIVPVDIIHIVNEIIQSYHLISNCNNISLITEYDVNLNYVYAHESSLFQIFANLISNAIKFTSINGQVLIRIYRVKKIISSIALEDMNQNHVSMVIRIEIIDEGIGIELSNQKQIFDRFVRIENNVHSLEGTGLGLSIVTNILKKHSTQIFVYSEPSVGTSLWFDLLPVE